MTVGAHTDGESTSGGNIHSAILHILGQLHKAHGGLYVNMKHFTAGFSKVNRSEDRSYKYEQEHAGKHRQCNACKRIAEETFYGKLTGAVVTLVCHS